jgi:AcrR family transcriptional regulator
MAAAKAKMKAGSRLRAPRSSLNAEKITEAALRIADEKGIDGISTRRLGEELGCSHTAVYQYFPTREDLLQATFDRALANAPRSIPMGGHWEDRARAVCMSIRRALMDHPACYELARLFPGRGVGLWANAMNSIAAEAGYSGEEVVALGRLLSQVAVDLTSGSAVRGNWNQKSFGTLARPEEQDLAREQARFSDDAIFATVVECLIVGLRQGVRLPATAVSTAPDR